MEENLKFFSARFNFPVSLCLYLWCLLVSRMVSKLLLLLLLLFLLRIQMKKRS